MDMLATKHSGGPIQRRPPSQDASRCWRPAGNFYGHNTALLKPLEDSLLVTPSRGRASTSIPSLSQNQLSSPHLQTQTHSPRPRPSFPQSQSPLSTAQRQSQRSSPKGSSDPDPPGPNPPDPQQPNGGPSGPGGGMPFRLRYWILLLAEYGGIYGTAAVVIAALTHIDAFGGLHWDANDVALGLGLMAPALLWDTLVGLPDWTTRQEDAEALVRLFVDPELLRTSSSSSSGASGAQKKQQPQQQGVGSQETEGSGQGEAAEAEAAASALAAATADEGQAGSRTGEDASAAAAAGAAAAAAAALPAGGQGASSSSSSSGGGGVQQQPLPSGALWAAAQRLRMALELMQETSIRNNPGARLTPLQEGAVIAVAVTADEMLYRAVLLTLFGRWLRDRFYEAGAEELLVLPGGAQLETAAAAQWAALAAGVAAGAAVFAAKAWQEATMARRLRELQLAEREEAAKALKKQRLAGTHISEEEMREQAARQARLMAAHESLVASIGMQGALVWVLEGAREVYQVTAAGAAFILTGNLAAPLAGSLAAQVLVSLYQRIGLQRNLQRRAEVVAKRRQRRQQEEAAAAAATASASTLAAAPAEKEEEEKEEGRSTGVDAATRSRDGDDVERAVAGGKE